MARARTIKIGKRHGEPRQPALRVGIARLAGRGMTSPGRLWKQVRDSDASRLHQRRLPRRLGRHARSRLGHPLWVDGCGVQCKLGESSSDIVVVRIWNLGLFSHDGFSEWFAGNVATRVSTGRACQQPSGCLSISENRCRNSLRARANFERTPSVVPPCSRTISATESSSRYFAASKSAYSEGISASRRRTRLASSERTAPSTWTTG